MDNKIIEALNTPATNSVSSKETGQDISIASEIAALPVCMQIEPKLFEIPKPITGKRKLPAYAPRRVWKPMYVGQAHRGAYVSGHATPSDCVDNTTADVRSAEMQVDFQTKMTDAQTYLAAKNIAALTDTLASSLGNLETSLDALGDQSHKLFAEVCMANFDFALSYHHRHPFIIDGNSFMTIYHAVLYEYALVSETPQLAMSYQINGINGQLYADRIVMCLAYISQTHDQANRWGESQWIITWKIICQKFAQCKFSADIVGKILDANLLISFANFQTNRNSLVVYTPDAISSMRYLIFARTCATMQQKKMMALNQAKLRHLLGTDRSFADLRTERDSRFTNDMVREFFATFLI